MTQELHELHESVPAPTQGPYGERFTPQQYETATPLLKLHDLGMAPELKLLDKLKPGELKRQDLKRRVVEGLREHGTLTHAAASAGISPSTIYRWRETDAEFNDAVTEFLNVDLVDSLVSSMYSIATSTDPKTANAAVKAGEFLLKGYAREQFGDQLKTEGTINISGQIDIAHQVQQQFRVEHAQLRDKAKALRTVDAEGGQK